MIRALSVIVGIFAVRLDRPCLILRRDLETGAVPFLRRVVNSSVTR